MRLDVFLHIVPDPETVRFQREVLRLLRKDEATMAKSLQDMLASAQATRAQIEKNTSATASIIALQKAGAQQLADVQAKLDAAIAAGNDPALLQQLSDELDTLQQKANDEAALDATAALANTPAAGQ